MSTSFLGQGILGTTTQSWTATNNIFNFYQPPWAPRDSRGLPVEIGSKVVCHLGGSLALGKVLAVPDAKGEPYHIELLEPCGSRQVGYVAKPKSERGLMVLAS